MQMNYKKSGQFEKLYPITLGDNVKLNNGQTLEQWKKQADDLLNSVEDTGYNVVWEGSEVMGKNTDGTAAQITISKKLSECNNGWILVFKDAGANSNYSYHYVPKYHTSILGDSTGMKFIMGASGNAVCSKFIFIGDTTIKGHTVNGTNGNDVIVLCKVLSY